MRPVEAASVKSSFALTVTSPVKAIIETYQVFCPTSFDASPSHAQASIPSSSQTTLDMFNQSAVPLTPVTPRRIRDEDIDLAFLDNTPSKQVRIAVSRLSATSSGFFLTSKTPYTFSTPFPHMLERTPCSLAEPNLSLINVSTDPRDYANKQAMAEQIKELAENLGDARTQVNALRKNQEVYAAQSVIRDLTLLKMNQTIWEHEDEKALKKSSITLPNKGYGCLWTEEKIMDYMREKRAEEEREAREKETWMRKHEEQKDRKAVLDAEWKWLKEKHEHALEDLLPKPKLVSKKELTKRMFGTPPAPQDGNNDDGMGNADGLSDENDETGGSEDDNGTD
ncbi:hypothetical protein K435DRAFT_852952 [Dendrothele bispora CBS 962.96]|uniref:Uncharacterized protein n=1 Tax=Dendrothele bispora (strain CBS 962.96) TaxID=1314807 RepID=A0A4S8MJE0_DENBC|nr:hypothetical protein K435DRAFT_852952 [Dendrothele bispora CBS 962.96]